MVKINISKLLNDIDKEIDKIWDEYEPINEDGERAGYIDLEDNSEVWALLTDLYNAHDNLENWKTNKTICK